MVGFILFRKVVEITSRLIGGDPEAGGGDEEGEENGECDEGDDLGADGCDGGQDAGFGEDGQGDGESGYGGEAFGECAAGAVAEAPVAGECVEHAGGEAFVVDVGFFFAQGFFELFKIEWVVHELSLF